MPDNENLFTKGQQFELILNISDGFLETPWSQGFNVWSAALLVSWVALSVVGSYEKYFE